ILPGATIAIFAGPGEEKLAQPVFDALEDRRTLAIIGHNDLVAVAAALKRCAFYIGNDSGLMHVAATVGTPTLGLFGPGYPSVYRPWGENGGYVSTPETIDELIAHHDYDRHTTSSLMESLSVKAVEQAARKLWKNRL
ncbi:MAG: glycosyltransferase family 9 protein, partial [Pseudomonadota bacterium]|nr:glycosyltransferase family 9 protein [Pseudomonadota bacterium]